MKLDVTFRSNKWLYFCFAIGFLVGGLALATDYVILKRSINRARITQVKVTWPVEFSQRISVSGPAYSSNSYLVIGGLVSSGIDNGLIIKYIATGETEVVVIVDDAIAKRVAVLPGQSLDYIHQ